MQRRVLSMWQPFASLLADGIKKVETRHFDTKFRGELYIHASQNMPKKEMYEDYYLKDEHFREIVNLYLHSEPNAVIPLQHLRERFIRGAIIGKATVKETYESQALKKLWEYNNRVDWQREISLGNLSSGRFGWLISNPTHFRKVVSMKGSQSIFWKLSDEIILPES
jgi:hypothetical protein